MIFRHSTEAGLDLRKTWSRFRRDLRVARRALHPSTRSATCPLTGSTEELFGLTIISRA